MPILSLNVGGVIFTTTTETLLWDVSESDGHNWFHNICYHCAQTDNTTASSDNHNPPPLMVEVVPNGPCGAPMYFIDRDPELFAVVLRFLRTHTLLLWSEHASGNTENSETFLRALIHEAKFYGCPELQAVVEQKLLHIASERNALANPTAPRLRGREEGYYSSDLGGNAAICFNKEKNTVLMAYGPNAATMLNVLRNCDPMPTIWSSDQENQRDFGALFQSRALRGSYTLESGVALRFAVSMHRSTMAVVTTDSLLVVITQAMKSIGVGEEGGGPSRWTFHTWM